MPVTHFNHYNLRAPSALLGALRDFYVDVVGLRVGPRPPINSPGYWLYVGDQAVLHLSDSDPSDSCPADSNADDATPFEARPPGKLRNGFDHAAFSCRDLAEFEARLQRSAVVYRIISIEKGQMQIFCSDPAGNGVELNFVPAD